MDVFTLMQVFRPVGEFLEEATKLATQIRLLGDKPDPEKVAEQLLPKLKDWKPEVRGKRILDKETKKAGARLLAGIACNLLE